MNRAALLAIALGLPLAGLGYSWASTHRLAQQGEEWLIPVTGYDPRDLLRGHFVQYRYDWPVGTDGRGSDASPREQPFEDASAICIEGKAPDITRAHDISGRVDRSGPGVRKASKPGCGPPARCDIVARASLGNRAEVRGLSTGILYVSQARGEALAARLADPKLRGFVRVKIREDGVMRPVDMEFRPRPAVPAQE